MKPFIVLLIAFVSACAVLYLAYGKWEICWAGNIAMSIMLAFTSLGHFLFPKGMAMMLPDFIPHKKLLIYLTGFWELLAAVGVLIPDLRHVTSLALILFFICIFPANVNAAMKRVNLEKANYEGNGPEYLRFRVPLQIFLIVWLWYFGV
jgi:uncharacterized membrane protein